MEENLNWKEELLQVMKIFHDNGVDVSSITTRAKDVRGKRQYITLKDLAQQRNDIEFIISQNGLDINFKIGYYLRKFKGIYSGSNRGVLSEEQQSIAEELGIVKKAKNNRQKPLIKGSKVSQFHVDIVRDNIDKILSGELSNADVIRIINELANQCDETQIYDNKTIRRIVEIVLTGKPEELKRYNEILEINMKKNLQTGGSGKRKELKPDYVSTVTNDYLPRYIRGEITLGTIEQELKTSHETLDRIIIGYYTKLGDNEGLKQYETMKRNNGGSSIERRETAKKRRKEIAQYDVVSHSEFLLLSGEEQDRQIIKKYRQEKLKQAQRNKTTGRISTEEAAETSLQKIKNYFRAKNADINGIEKFSEQDIRYIIFRYPSILGREAQTLDEKFEILTSYDEIDMQTACGMIKTFPAVIGYSVERTKSQLDLLQKENLIDYVISIPSGMMRSVKMKNILE